jgi:hypothetical protein
MRYTRGGVGAVRQIMIISATRLLISNLYFIWKIIIEGSIAIGTYLGQNNFAIYYHINKAIATKKLKNLKNLLDFVHYRKTEK